MTIPVIGLFNLSCLGPAALRNDKNKSSEHFEMSHCTGRGRGRRLMEHLSDSKDPAWDRDRNELFVGLAVRQAETKITLVDRLLRAVILYFIFICCLSVTQHSALY